MQVTLPANGCQPQKAEARKDMQLLDGGLLLSKNSLGMITLQASRPTPPLSKSGLFYGCTGISVIFVCQASIRYQTQRTKIKPREQRKPVEVAICFPLFKSTRASLWAGHCSSRSPFHRSWCLRMRHKAFEKSSERQTASARRSTPTWQKRPALQRPRSALLFYRGMLERTATRATFS